VKDGKINTLISYIPQATRSALGIVSCGGVRDLGIALAGNDRWKTYAYQVLLVVITCLGVLARYLWIRKIPNEPESDFAGYYQIAISVYHHQGVTLHGNPVAFQGMAYPTALGLFFRLVGNTDVMTGKYFNLILSSVSLVLFYFVLKQIFAKKLPLVIACYAILALLPNYIAYNSVLGTEILYTFFMTATICVQFMKIQKWIKYPLLGVLIALASLTRPFFVVYPVLFAIAEWISRKTWKQIVVSSMAVTLSMILVIAPWTYRNYRVFHVFVPISYNGGYVLFLNNNSNNWVGGWMPPDQITVSDAFKKKFLEIGTEYGQHPPQADELYKRAAESWIVHHPLEFLELGFLKVRNTFFNGGSDIEKWTMNGLNQSYTKLNAVQYARILNVFKGVTDIIVYVLSTFGFAFMILHLKPIFVGLFRRKKVTIDYPSVVLALNIAFYVAVYFVTEGQPRYDFPVLFFFVICTVKCLYVLIKNMNANCIDASK
jgi:hypothetical protein